MPPRTVTVIGSLNIDFVTRTPRIPQGGETLTATSFTTGYGGKGANQAVACARLADPTHVKVCMVGNVGDDVFGKGYISLLEKEGIDTKGVGVVSCSATGTANIIVEEESGENRILLARGANYPDTRDGLAGRKDLKREEKGIDSSNASPPDLISSETDMAIFQLEIPLETVLHNVTFASERGVHVLFNPAPAVPLPKEVYRHVSTLVVNETEATILAGPLHIDVAAEGLGKVASRFLEIGVKDAVIITLGEKGLIYATKDGENGQMEAEKVKVHDTTAAGDTFVGAYAVLRIGEKLSCREALQKATHASALTVQRLGAMDAIPTRSEVGW
ncbi:Ribokinase-like protein [Piedraia hortae CBS 480.64]|uniref:Ribokinase n=1 Tax=Piedraia hortae CBS 480.64 TaxID=1314780 RepID=A0A6A7BWY6_9PEZI|nr:Ribokinase-like protein [Piedraia hortae CBS 480.64]